MTKRIFKCLAAFLLVFSIFQAGAFAAIKITPNKFEFTIKPNSQKKIISGSFMVQAGDDETIRFKVYPEYFEIAEDGSVITDLGSEKESMLTQNIRFNPTEFTLSPGDPQRVRFTIPNIQSLSDGEHRIALFLEDVKTREQALPTQNKNVSAYVYIKTRVGIPIYIERGNVQKTASIEKLALEKSNNKYQYVVHIKSNGNSKIRVEGNAQIIKGKELISEFPVNGIPIQAGNTGKIKSDLPVDKLNPNEEYKLKLTISYPDQKEKNRYLVNELKFKLNDIPNIGDNI